jgi:hypothetical protein
MVGGLVEMLLGREGDRRTGDCAFRFAHRHSGVVG